MFGFSTFHLLEEDFLDEKRFLNPKQLTGFLQVNVWQLIIEIQYLERWIYQHIYHFGIYSLSSII